MVDDLIDTGATLIAAAKLLRGMGATDIYAMVTHGLFSNGALEKLNESTIKKILVSNSINQQRSSPKLEIISMAPVITGTIKSRFRILNAGSSGRLHPKTAPRMADAGL